MVVIKKSENPQYAFFIGMNREEKYNKTWDGISNHWKEYPDVFGYKDNKTGGTWFAFNKDLIGILINRESEFYEHLGSRSNIVLQTLISANEIQKAISNLSILDLSKIKPFNLLLLTRDEAYWITNLKERYVSNQILLKAVHEDLVMINRSHPNDFNEKRIALNFEKFKIAKEPIPSENDWREWEQILTEESTAETCSQENTLWLNSQEWGTLTSDIIALPNDKDMPVIVRNIKKRKLV